MTWHAVAAEAGERSAPWEGEPARRVPVWRLSRPQRARGQALLAVARLKMLLPAKSGFPGLLVAGLLPTYSDRQRSDLLAEIVDWYALVLPQWEQMSEQSRIGTAAGVVEYVSHHIAVHDLIPAGPVEVLNVS